MKVMQMNFAVETIVNYWLELILTIISGVCIAIIKTQHNKIKALMVGTQALLRAELIRSGEKYTKQGWLPIYAKDAFDKAYKSYHGLGGNGTMTELHEKVMELPTNPPSTKRKD